MLPDHLQYQRHMTVSLTPDDAKRKMFNNTSGRKDFQAKQEGDSNEQIMLPKYTTTSRQWGAGGLKNPRIVRVSKAFGGKDRHSKVCTVKGLRDRRIRLSVPTAIQLYDLQHKLGLSQPSKVIDWLLDSTKDDIDQLPPLQMLFGDHFNQFQYPALPTALIPQDLNSPQISLTQLLKTQNATFAKDEINGDHQRKKGKEAVVEHKSYEQENGGLNFFPIPQYSYNPGLFPYNPYSNWEPCSNISIPQFGNQGLVNSSQTDSSIMTLPSASQLLLGTPTAITPSAFPPFMMPNLGENRDLLRQNNYFHLLSSSSQHVPPNPLMPFFNLSDSQEKVPFGLDAHNKNDR